LISPLNYADRGDHQLRDDGTVRAENPVHGSDRQSCPASRPDLSWADRALLASLLSEIPKARRHGLRLLVTPDTILRWHPLNFRNVLCVTTLLIVILMTLFVLLVSRNPSMVPFCFTPSAGHHVCPSGSPAPAPGDVVLVTGLGLLGGALAAAFAIRNIRGTSTPYDIPIALAALKVPTGALTAAAGLLLLRGQFVPGLSALDSQEQILAYALVLGYAQQIFTRLVDRQAQSILDKVPSKETCAVQLASAPGPRAAVTPRSP
jgi:hypothetical protein